MVVGEATVQGQDVPLIAPEDQPTDPNATWCSAEIVGRTDTAASGIPLRFATRCRVGGEDVSMQVTLPDLRDLETGSHDVPLRSVLLGLVRGDGTSCSGIFPPFSAGASGEVSLTIDEAIGGARSHPALVSGDYERAGTATFRVSGTHEGVGARSGSDQIRDCTFTLTGDVEVSFRQVAGDYAVSECIADGGIIAR
jgi:hypothetical protein